MDAMYLVANKLPLDEDPQPRSVVIASITLDPVYTRHIVPVKVLESIAARMGLFEYEITTASAQEAPNNQLQLPFPTLIRARKRH